MINVTEFQNNLYLQWAGKAVNAGKENWGIIRQWYLSKTAKDKEWSYIHCKSNDITYSIWFYSRLCPSAAGSSPRRESSNLFCPLLSLSIPLPVAPQCHLSNDVWSSDWSYTLYLPLCTSNSPIYYLNDVTYLELIQNDFWQEVVATYLDNKSNTELEQINHTNFKKQYLFSNDLIRYKGNSFLPKMSK